MTKAKLTVWIDWDSDKTGIGADLPGPNSYTMDFDIERDDQSVTIEITPDAVRMHTMHEPHRAIIPDLDWDTRQNGEQ